MREAKRPQSRPKRPKRPKYACNIYAHLEIIMAPEWQKVGVEIWPRMIQTERHPLRGLSVRFFLVPASSANARRLGPPMNIFMLAMPARFLAMLARIFYYNFIGTRRKAFSCKSVSQPISDTPVRSVPTQKREP